MDPPTPTTTPTTILLVCDNPPPLSFESRLLELDVSVACEETNEVWVTTTVLPFSSELNVVT